MPTLIQINAETNITSTINYTIFICYSSFIDKYNFIFISIFLFKMFTLGRIPDAGYIGRRRKLRTEGPKIRSPVGAE